jgi:hypothetical protein
MLSRRHFLQTTAGVTLTGWLTELNLLGSATAAETAVTPDIVQLNPAIEPIVRLIETTPRRRCFDMMVQQLRDGLPYRQFLAALYLAGIRNVSPQPPGFKFHCVFVIHAAHQLSLDAPVGDRLLPLFWALDFFKASQQKDVEEGDFTLKQVTGRLPSPEKAWDEFHAAMDAWDEERADRAIAALVRSRGANEIIEGLWRYGARDYRNIGHKSIFVANTWRTLQTIGWQHAEPALRSLILGLLDFGKDGRVNEYAYEDQSYLPNAQRAAQAIGGLPGDWTVGNAERSATIDVLDAIRTGDLDGAGRQTVDQLAQGKVKAQAVWDAVHLAGGELMMQQPGIYGIHTVTSVNGLRYAYETCADPETRLVLLLQGVGWMCQFRNFMASRPQGLQDVDITKLQPSTIDEQPAAAAENILAAISTNRTDAAAQALAFAQKHPQPHAFQQAALQAIFHKGTDAHDYKYAAAVFEDYELVSEAWRPHILATAVYHLPGASQSDSALMNRAREAVRRL